MNILKIRFFHVTKGPNIGSEPNFHGPLTSNVKDYPEQPKMGRFLTLRYSSPHHKQKLGNRIPTQNLENCQHHPYLEEGQAKKQSQQLQANLPNELHLQTSGAYDQQAIVLMAREVRQTPQKPGRLQKG